MNSKAFALEIQVPFKKMQKEILSIWNLSVPRSDRFTKGEMEILTLWGPKRSFKRPSPFHYCQKPAANPGLNQCPGFKDFIKQFGADLLMARVISMEPGTRVIPHRDPGRNFEFGVARLNAPLISPPGSAVFMDHEKVPQKIPMSPGEIWYLDGATPHSAVHHGKGKRIHLVCDLRMSAQSLRFFPHALRREFRRTNDRYLFIDKVERKDRIWRFQAPLYWFPVRRPSDEVVKAEIEIKDGKATLRFLKNELELSYVPAKHGFFPSWVGAGFFYKVGRKFVEVSLSGLLFKEDSQRDLLTHIEKRPLL